MGAAFFNTQIKVKHNGQTEKQRDRQRDRYTVGLSDRRHCFRQIDVAKGQQTKQHSHSHAARHFVCPLLSHLPNLILSEPHTHTHKTKAAHLSLSWGIIQMKPMNLSISKCFPSKFIIRNCRRKIKITIKRRQKIFTPGQK